MKKLFIKSISIILALFITLSSCFTAFAGEQLFGYDVSHNNDVIDCVDAKNNGKSFVMIRLGYYNHLDKNFWANVENACENEMQFGVYLYSYAYSTQEAQIEADFVVDTLSQLGDRAKYFTLPVAYDLEDEKMLSYGKTQITNQMTTFCDTIKNAGYVPMVYANRNWFTNYININTVKSKAYKIWYAYPNDGPNFSSKIQVGSTGVYADMWQYKHGDSTKKTLDENVIYDSSSLIKPLSCYHNYIKSTVVPTCTAKGYDLRKCKNCGKSYKTITTAALGHSYKCSVTKRATQSVNGVRKYTCSRCKYSYTKAISKIKSVKLSAAKYTYNAKVKAPSATVKDSAGKTLKKNTDYTVTYAKGRKNVGKYSVKITFKGAYSGSKTLYFTIVPKATSLSSLSARSKGFTVKWKKQAEQTTGYQIQYSTSSKFTSPKYVTVGKNKTVSKTVGKLKGKKKYYVRIRTYKTVGKTKYYSAWSKAKSVTTKK